MNLESRRRLISSMLERDRERRAVQLDALKDRDIGVLRDNPTFGLQNFDSKLYKFTKISKDSSKSFNEHNHGSSENDGEPVKTFGNVSKELEDENDEMCREAAREEFQQVILSDLDGAVRNFKEKQRKKRDLRERNAGGISGEENGNESEEFDGVDEDPLEMGGDSKSEKKGVEVGKVTVEQDDEAEEKLAQMWQDFYSLCDSPAKATKTNSSSENDAQKPQAVDIEPIVKESASGENVKTGLKKLQSVPKVDIRKVKGQEYLDLLLGDFDDGEIDFVHVDRNDQGWHTDYAVGKMYDFGTTHCKLWPEFDYDKLEADDTQEMSQLKDLEDEMNTLCEKYRSKRFTKHDLSVAVDMEASQDEMSRLFAPEQVCEEEADNIAIGGNQILLAKETPEKLSIPDSTGVYKSKIETQEAKDDESIEKLEERLRKSMQIEKISTSESSMNVDGYDEDEVRELNRMEIECEEDDSSCLEGGDEPNEKLQPSHEKSTLSRLGRKMSKFFVKKKKDNMTIADVIEVKPWDVKLDEMRYYANRDLRGELQRKGISFNSNDSM